MTGYLGLPVVVLTTLPWAAIVEFKPASSPWNKCCYYLVSLHACLLQVNITGYYPPVTSSINKTGKVKRVNILTE